MDIQCGDRALVHDIRYATIRVETDDVSPAPRLQGSRDERYLEAPQDHYVPDLLVIVICKNFYSKDAERGNVREVTYADVSVTGRRAPRSFFNGLDTQHTVQRVTIDNLRLNGKLTQTAAEANLSVGPYLSGVRFMARPRNSRGQRCEGPSHREAPVPVRAMVRWRTAAAAQRDQTKSVIAFSISSFERFLIVLSSYDITLIHVKRPSSHGGKRG